MYCALNHGYKLIFTDRPSHESMLCTFSPDVKTIVHVVQYKIRRWRGTSVARAIAQFNAYCACACNSYSMHAAMLTAI